MNEHENKNTLAQPKIERRLLSKDEFAIEDRLVRTNILRSDGSNSVGFITGTETYETKEGDETSIETYDVVDFTVPGENGEKLVATKKVLQAERAQYDEQIRNKERAERELHDKASKDLGERAVPVVVAQPGQIEPFNDPFTYAMPRSEVMGSMNEQSQPKEVDSYDHLFDPNYNPVGSVEDAAVRTPESHEDIMNRERRKADLDALAHDAYMRAKSRE